MVSYQKDKYIGQLCMETSALVQVTHADKTVFQNKLQVLDKCMETFIKRRCQMTKAELTQMKDSEIDGIEP